MGIFGIAALLEAFLCNGLLLYLVKATYGQTRVHFEIGKSMHHFASFPIPDFNLFFETLGSKSKKVETLDSLNLYHINNFDEERRQGDNQSKWQPCKLLSQIRWKVNITNL